MEIFIIWTILSILVGSLASGKGRSGFGYFLLAFLLSPIIGFIAVLVAGDDSSKLESEAIESGSMRKCPYCAELVRAEAIVCKHCGRDLPSVQAVNLAKKFKLIDNYDGTYQVGSVSFSSKKEAMRYLANMDQQQKS